MTTKTYYKASLALPIVLPLLFLPVGDIAKDAALASLSSALTVTLLYGGIPYVLLALGLLFWMSDKTTEETEKAIAWSPILMSIPLLLCAGVLTVGGGGFGGLLFIWLITSFCAVFVGYIYVVVAKLLLELLKVMHKVHDED